MRREDHAVIYTSSSNKWDKYNIIEFIEHYYGIKLKWYQKISLLFINFKNKRKHGDIEKVIRRYVRNGRVKMKSTKY